MAFIFKLMLKDGTHPLTRHHAKCRQSLRVIDARPGQEPDDDFIRVVEAAQPRVSGVRVG